MAAEERREASDVTRRGFVGWVLGLSAGVVALVAGIPMIGALVGQPPAAEPGGVRRRRPDRGPADRRADGTDVRRRGPGRASSTPCFPTTSGS